MADLRKSMDRILHKYGWDILLQRRIETDADVPKWKNSLERHTIRGMLPGSSMGIAGVAREQEPGVTHDADMVYYFRYNANPNEGDRIYDNVGREDGDVRRYTIDWAAPMRGVNGRVEYWTVGATREKG